MVVLLTRIFLEAPTWVRRLRRTHALQATGQASGMLPTRRFYGDGIGEALGTAPGSEFGDLAGVRVGVHRFHLFDEIPSNMSLSVEGALYDMAALGAVIMEVDLLSAHLSNSASGAVILGGRAALAITPGSENSRN